MWRPFKKKHKKIYPTKDMSLDELKQGIRQYINDLPNEVPLSTLINDDLTINYQKLAPYLNARPIQTYYMSKETYDIFDENQKQLAEDLDYIQRAVDQYIQLSNELPVIHGDPYLKVSYHKLMKRGLITYRPTHEFFIDSKDHLINYARPK
ncbi:hypothetical protein GCM10012290_19860 [Halolactibacillus alkaliphilus]|uniref:DUF3939 domain-containing protein n=1 Tax=Halolactibacillus alkaliphilus TaxID=442899 RepID=A0A511X362_9BACI|nr:DUF3939 domain-containing protein [Halolactibacillus alkaliphilus]GEN57384.1 hypothetical protein HAL01_18480 [Halolactibacillus alkaliphilus]GGN73239.1 hypothetical protein GCM10012290_19860 [Halolactibacillus alkaliphilus]SFO93898.1 Protein of unknown function [Halolactibacillus alkaliphilus]